MTQSIAIQVAGPTTVQMQQRTLDARPDTIDFRDQMYIPTLTECPG
jgi:hypothetical protein